MAVVTRRTLDRLVPTAIVAAIVAALFSQTRHFGLLGFDAYPILVSSRIGSLADLLGTFTEKLMDGRYAGDFYRPLLNLSFALDHAVWGLNAFGYQLTNALLLATCGWALWALLRRLLGPGTWIGPVMGLLVFLLSPLQWEVLPVPPRRPELLCLAFMALAVNLQLRPRALQAPRPPVGPAIVTLLAIASKETAFILPALIGVAVLLYSARDTTRGRLAHAAVATVPHLAAVGLMLVVRFSTLGGPGGHGTAALPGPLSVWNGMKFIAEGLALPQPAMRTALGYGIVVLLAAAVVLAVGLRRGVASVESRRASARSFKAALLAVSWIVLLCGIYVAGSVGFAWYFLVPLAGWAMLAAALVEMMLVLVEDDDGKLRTVTMIVLTLLAVTVVWQASYSPIIRTYDEWERATAASEAYLQATRRQIEGASAGTIVEGRPVPYSVKTHHSRRLGGVTILSDYSVQAWADLTLPGRNVRVHQRGGAVQPPAPDEIVLLIPGSVDVE